MRGFFTDYYSQSIMAKLMAGTALPSFFPPLGTTVGGKHAMWVGMSYTIPDTAGNNVNEPTALEYARQPIITDSSSNGCDKDDDGLYTNALALQFPQPQSDWSGAGLPFICVCLFDQSTGGKLLGVDINAVPPTFQTASYPGMYIPAGALRFGINPRSRGTGVISSYLVNYITNYLYKTGSSFSQLSLYQALLDKEPHQKNTGSTIPEIANSNAYARQAVPGWQLVRVTGDGSTGAGVYGNNGPIPSGGWPTPTGTWGSQGPPPAWALVDSSSYGSGNFYWGGRLRNVRTLDATQPPPYFGINSVKVGLGM